MPVLDETIWEMRFLNRYLLCKWLFPQTTCVSQYFRYRVVKYWESTQLSDHFRQTTMLKQWTEKVTSIGKIISQNFERPWKWWFWFCQQKCSQKRSCFNPMSILKNIFEKTIEIILVQSWFMKGKLFCHND